MGIAPMESDLFEIRRTLKAIETCINNRDTQTIHPLISPYLTPPEKRDLLHTLETMIQSLTEDTRFTLRSNVGRGALIPIGPDQVELQITGSKIRNENPHGISINFKLEARETERKRRWLLKEITFDGQVKGVADQISSIFLLLPLGLLALIVFALISRKLYQRKKFQTP